MKAEFPFDLLLGMTDLGSGSRIQRLWETCPRIIVQFLTIRIMCKNFCTVSFGNCISSTARWLQTGLPGPIENSNSEKDDFWTPPRRGHVMPGKCLNFALQLGTIPIGKCNLYVLLSQSQCKGKKYLLCN